MKINLFTIPASQKRKKISLLLIAVFILGLTIYFSVLIDNLAKNKFSGKTRAELDESPFCFAHISDAHADIYPEPLSNAVTYFNEVLKPPFIIDTGDTVSNDTGSNFDLYREQVRTLKSDIYGVPGNHDYQGGDDSIELFKEFFGGTKVVFDYHSYRFIGLDYKNIDYQWLEDQLKGKEGKAILFSHLAVIWPPDFTHWLLMAEDDQNKIKNLMNKYQVLAFLSGHFHIPFTLTSEKILNIGAPSLGKRNSFQLICINQSTVTNSVVDIGQEPLLSVTPEPTKPPEKPTSTPIPTPTPTFAPERKILYLKTGFQSPSGDSTQKFRVTLTAKGTDFSASFILPAGGESEAVDLNGLEPGKTYELILSSWGFLSVKKSLKVASGRNPAEPATFLDFGLLKTGDLNADNQINGLDWSLMKMNFGESGDE